MKKMIALTIGLLTASIAVAQQTGPREGGDHEARAAAFAASDSNRDGRLSLAEFEAARTQRLAEQFAKMDSRTQAHALGTQAPGAGDARAGPRLGHQRRQGAEPCRDR